MPIRLPNFDYGRKNDFSSGIKSAFGSGNIFQTLAGLVGAGEQIDPMKIIGWSSPFGRKSPISEALGTTGKSNVTSDIWDRVRGGGSRGGWSGPSWVGTYGTPSGTPVKVWDGSDRVSPIYRDDKGHYWSPTNDGRWRRVNYNPNAGGSGFPDGGTDPATGDTGRLGPIEPKIPRGFG